MTERYDSARMETMLRAHYAGSDSKPEAGYFLTELVAPYLDRRIDGLYVPLSSQLRGQLWGIEVKVSRADLMVELNDPRKADAWLQYCNRWWLAVSDPAWLEGLEIPEHWGIMSPPSGRSKRLMTVHRMAPKLKPTNQAAAFAVVMARLYFSGGDAETTIKRLKREVADGIHFREDLIRQRTELDRQLRAVTTLPEEEARIQEVLKRIYELMTPRGGGQSLYGYLQGNEWDVDTIARAVLDAAVVRRDTLARVNRLKGSRDTLTRGLESMLAALQGGDQMIEAAVERIRAELGMEKQ